MSDAGRRRCGVSWVVGGWVVPWTDPVRRLGLEVKKRGGSLTQRSDWEWQSVKAAKRSVRVPASLQSVGGWKLWKGRSSDLRQLEERDWSSRAGRGSSNC